MLHPLEPTQEQGRVAILLATYQGQNYLSAQLDSIQDQSCPDWFVWASDDGSIDGTRDILHRYRAVWGAQKLNICDGPQKGFVENFLSLICNENINAEFFAYSDQDDIWENDKLNRALTWLKAVPSHIPALYCSRTQLVDEAGKGIGLSPLFRKPPSFSNALTQSLAGGNTMVFNQAARELLQLAGQQVGVVTHDWWTYIVVSACGGRVFYDEHPTLKYRQHSGNLIGMNSSWRARFLRIGMLWRGQFRVWNDVHIAALKSLGDHLSPESEITLEGFSRARQSGLFARVWGLSRCGVYRQTGFGDAGLIFASIFKKI